MEIPEILRLTHELMQLRDDRMQMAFEDDRSHLCRSLFLANKKIERLTKCLKSASDDYDSLMKTVLNATGSNIASKKRSAEETLNKSSKVRISENPCLSPVKPESPQKVASNHLTSSMKKSTPASPVKASNAPALEINSPESVDFLNPLSKGSELLAGGKSTSPSIVKEATQPLPVPRLMQPAPLVLQSKRDSAKSDASSSSRSEVNMTTSTGSNSMRPPVKPKDTNYPALDLIDTKKVKKQTNAETVTATTTSVKLHRSSTVVTSSSSSAVVAKPVTESSSKLSRASTVSSHDRRSDNYKCIDVVREKAERDALPGHTCFECEAFYQAMIQQGIMTEDSKKEHLKQCSRHKAKHTPPTTPDGFWDLTIHTPEEWK